MSGKWKRGMVAILWHSQTKGRETVNTNCNLNHAPVLDSIIRPFRGAEGDNPKGDAGKMGKDAA
jgi:hypothetical protein